MNRRPSTTITLAKTLSLHFDQPRYAPRLAAPAKYGIGELDRSELTALVRVHDLGHTVLGERLLDDFLGVARFQCDRNLVRQHFAAEHVHHCGEVGCASSPMGAAKLCAGVSSASKCEQACPAPNLSARRSPPGHAWPWPAARCRRTSAAPKLGAGATPRSRPTCTAGYAHAPDRPASGGPQARAFDDQPAVVSAIST